MILKTEKTKRAILRALEGERVLKCPFCEHDTFIRETIEKRKVKIIDEDDSMRDEEISDNFDASYKYSCEECRRDITEDELI